MSDWRRLGAEQTDRDGGLRQDTVQGSVQATIQETGQETGHESGRDRLRMTIPDKPLNRNQRYVTVSEAS